MAQMNLSNTLWNDDSSGTIALVEQLKDRLLHTYIANNPNYSTTDKNRIPVELKAEVGVFQEKLNEFFLDHWVDFQRFLLDEGVDPETIDSWKEVQEFLEGLPDDETMWLKNKLAALDTAIAGIDQDGIGVFDVSAYNNIGGTYATYNGLSAALAAIPTASKRSGMTVRYIDSTSNQYEEYRYFLQYEDTTAGNASFNNTANWQGIDDEPTAGSNNLVESGGIIKQHVLNSNLFSLQGSYYRATDGSIVNLTGCYGTHYIRIGGKIEAYCYLGKTGTFPQYGMAFFDKNFNFLDGYNADDAGTNAGMQKVVIEQNDIPSSAVYVTAMIPSSDNLDKAYIVSGFQNAQNEVNDILDRSLCFNAGLGQKYVSGLNNIVSIKGVLNPTNINSSNTDSFIAISVNGGESLVINAKTGGRIVFVKEFDPREVYPYAYVLATGETKYRSIDSGFNGTIPSDTKYVLVKAGSYLPSSFVIDGFELSTDIKKKLIDINDNIESLSESIIENSHANSHQELVLIETEGYWRTTLNYSNAAGFKRSDKLPVQKGDIILVNSINSPYGTAANIVFNADGTAFDVLPVTNGKAVITDALWESGVRYIGLTFRLSDSPTPSMTIMRKVNTILGNLDETPTQGSEKFVNSDGIFSAFTKPIQEIQENVLGIANCNAFHGNLESTRIISHPTAEYIVIKVGGGERVVVPANANPSGVFVLLKEFEYCPALPYSYVFATGETAYHGMTAAYDADIPSDTRYILIRVKNSNGIITIPSSFKINGYDIVKSLYEVLNAKITAVEEELEQIASELEYMGCNNYIYKGNAPASFKEKLLMMQDDLNIVLLGDSMTGLTNLVGDEFPNAANLPPGCQRNAITYMLWDALSAVKPQCDRFDSTVNTFTENGTFALSDVNKQSADNYGEYSPDNCVYRETSIANDSVSFNWSLDDFEKLNFIGRMGTDGSGKIRISCTSGKIVVVHNNRMNPIDGYTDGQLVEANGYEFTQNLPVGGQYDAQWLRNMPIKMKRATGATGSVTVTFTNITNAAGSVMYYWGTERWNFNTVHVTNIGRGGRNMAALRSSLYKELEYRDIDLVIFQLPLWNEIKGGGDAVSPANTQFGNIYSWLESKSNNWQKYQVIVNMYHTQKESWDGNNSLQFQANGDTSRPKTDLPDWITCHQIFGNVNAYKDTFLTTADLQKEVYNWANSNNMTMEDLLSTGRFTVDNTHCSSLGFRFYASMIKEMMYD